MEPALFLSLLVGYFSLLLLISWITSRGATNESFFIGNHKSPWYLVAFGMIGTSISGVTFVSVPGYVLDNGFSYMQLVMGYFVGYIIIALVLMPVYYKLQLTSIYTYLDSRFGPRSYKTGAFFFLLSRSIGSAVRLFLAANVLQIAVFNSWNVPFYLTISVTIAFIWVYTFKGGIKTIIWTDSIQTLFFLVAVGITVYVISSEMKLSVTGIMHEVASSKYSKIFFFDNFAGDKRHFLKQFLSGILICVSMTGLDQDLMQKNLSCRNIREAKKNMLVFSVISMFVNLLFLSLGALLYIYASRENIALPASTDEVYPYLATRGFLPAITAVVFLLGLIASTCSSSDSALTALTTSYVYDIMGKSRDDENKLKKTRQRVHLGFSVLLLVIVMLFKLLNNNSIIDALFTIAAYTYGPLLGLYAFGFFSKLKVKDRLVPAIAIASPILSYVIYIVAKQAFGFTFGFEILAINAGLTIGGMFAIRERT